MTTACWPPLTALGGGRISPLTTALPRTSWSSYPLPPWIGSQGLIPIRRITRSEGTDGFAAGIPHCQLAFQRAVSSRPLLQCAQGQKCAAGWTFLFLGVRVNHPFAVWPWVSQLPSLDLGSLVCKGGTGLIRVAPVLICDEASRGPSMVDWLD